MNGFELLLKSKMKCYEANGKGEHKFLTCQKSGDRVYLGGGDRKQERGCRGNM